MNLYDLNIERCVLSYLTADSGFIKNCIDGGLTEQTFYLQAHREIWKALKAIHDDGLTIELVLLENRLGGVASFSDPLKNAFLEMINCSSLGVDQRDWIHALRVLEGQRTLLKGFRELQGEMEDKRPPSLMLEKLKDMVKDFEIMTNRSKARTVSDQLKESLAFIESLQTGKGGAVVPWGISGLDHVCKLQRGQIFTLAAPCGCGKTRFILNDLIGKIRLGVPSVLFSYENSGNVIFLGLKSILSGIPEDDLTSPGGIRDKGIDRLKNSFDFLHKGKGLFRVFGKGNYKHTPGGIATELRRLKDAGFFPDMVYVDYLQNMTLGSRSNSRTEELEKIVFDLAELTSEFGAALVILSQLNRDKTRAESKRRAGVADLKGSSALEQISDYIFFLSNADPSRRGIFPMDFYSVKARSSRGCISEALTFDSLTGAILGVEARHRYGPADRPERRAI